MSRNINIIPQSLIYQNLCIQFHFLVGWLALVIQDDALEMETNRILSKHQQVNQGESTTLEACEQGYSPYFYFPQRYLQKTIKHKHYHYTKLSTWLQLKRKTEFKFIIYTFISIL